TAAVLHLAGERHDATRSGYIRTPRPMRPRVTPAVAGLLAHGSSPPTTFPGNEFPVVIGRRLAAYSCGGSRGIVGGRTDRVPFSFLAGTTADHPAERRQQGQRRARVHR